MHGLLIKRDCVVLSIFHQIITEVGITNKTQLKTYIFATSFL